MIFFIFFTFFLSFSSYHYNFFSQNKKAQKKNYDFNVPM